jgi:hypothetical protein
MRRQEERVLRIQAEYGAVERECKLSSAGLFLQLPLIIMTLRTSLDSLIRASYPLWMHTVEGSAALVAMDKVTFFPAYAAPSGWWTMEMHAYPCMAMERFVQLHVEP